MTGRREQSATGVYDGTLGSFPAGTFPTGPELDLRVTWPERQMRIYERFINDDHPGARAYARVTLPPLPEFLQLVGGRMPLTFYDLKDTEFANRLLGFWEGNVSRGMPAEAAALQARSDLRWAFHAEWWQYEGHRVYALDALTAHALLNTDLDDFPTDQLHLPVNSFFIRVPRELNWGLDIGTMDVEYSPLNTPYEQHPEPLQPLDGFMITGEHDDSGKLVGMSLVVCGLSGRDLLGDHLMWLELGLGGATLGEVMSQLLESDGTAEKDIPLPAQRELTRLILGTILYVTSAHPHLRAIAPPSPGRLAKARKDPKQAKRFRERSRYAITYVGGPQQGFQAQEDEAPVDQLHRKPPRPHHRSGHWKWVPIGPRGGGQTRHTWVQPVMVGSWDRIAAWETLRGLRITIKKTRPAETIPYDQEEA